MQKDKISSKKTPTLVGVFLEEEKQGNWEW